MINLCLHRRCSQTTKHAPEATASLWPMGLHATPKPDILVGRTMLYRTNRAPQGGLKRCKEWSLVAGKQVEGSAEPGFDSTG